MPIMPALKWRLNSRAAQPLRVKMRRAVAVLALPAERQRLVEVAGADDREDRAEDLFAGQTHRRLHAVDARSGRAGSPSPRQVERAAVERDLGAFALGRRRGSWRPGRDGPRLMTGPMSTSAPPSVGPTFIAAPAAQALRPGRRRCRPTGTATLPAMQRSPAQPKADACSALTAWSRSASGMMIRWFFAPPAACTRLPWRVPVS